MSVLMIEMCTTNLGVQARTQQLSPAPPFREVLHSSGLSLNVPPSILVNKRCTNKTPLLNSVLVSRGDKRVLFMPDVSA